MTAIVRQPVISPIVVGREAQLATIDAALERAARSEGGALLVSGEAGIGKSRLLSEAARRCQSDGGFVARGACYETDRALPWAPFADLLRGLLADGHGAATEALAAAPELATLLPERATSPLPDMPDDGGRETRRVVEAFARFVVSLAAMQPPLLLVLEDLHWCDDLSLACLAVIARRIRQAPVVLALTWRSDEQHESLDHCLVTLDRLRIATELPLARLDTAEVDRMLRAIFGQPQPIRSDFLRAIVGLTDGNPFFIEEVVGALVASGDIFRAGSGWSRRQLPELHIPRSVHDAVTTRMKRLSPEARWLLQVAAVYGQRVDVEVAREVSGLAPPALLAAVRELVAAQLLVDASAEQLAFRHALTREAVSAGMLALERRQLHAAIARAVERRPGAPEARLADLAYHAWEAGDWEAALGWAGRAADRAAAIDAPRVVVTQATRAIDAASALGRPPPASRYRQRGLAAAQIGDRALALADLTHVLTAARALGDTAAEWQALLDLGELWLGIDYARAGDVLSEAATLAHATGDPLMVARSLIQLANWHNNRERPVAARALLEEALAIFEQAGDRPGIALATDLLGIVADISGDIVTMQGWLERAAALYAELGDRRGLSSTLATITGASGSPVFDAIDYPASLPLATAREYAQRSLALAREIDWAAGEAYALLNLSLPLTHRGDFGPALDCVTQALAIAEEIEHREWMTCGQLALGVIQRRMYELPAAHDSLRRAVTLAHESGSLHFLHLTVSEFAECCLARGDRDEAATALKGIPPTLPLVTLGQRRVWLARAMLALACGDAPRALEIAGWLTTARDGRDAAIPPVLALRGRALIATHQLDAAGEALRLAVTHARGQEAHPLLIELHLLLADLARLAGKHDAALQEVAAARGILSNLAARLPNPEQRERFLERAGEWLARHGGQPAAAGAMLTRREREVARCVARGLTNRQIAGELFVGERTVETHVSNLLAKLGLSSRAQIAVWAVSSGLAQPISG